jgi:S-adenosylmethionine:tRNA ribosyltransferase-isomerase
MLKREFHYDVPADLIAQRPATERSASRLLRLPPSAPPQDLAMRDLPSLLAPGDLLVFNDTRVIPARVLGRKETGGRVEILVERVLDDREFLAQLGFSKTPKAESRIFAGDDALTVLGREDDLFRLRYEGQGDVMSFLERVGRTPLPPYIHHAPDAADAERYQTVFAKQPGAVAAPTAGLHFDDALLASLRERGVTIETLTLHVGAGTFQPVRVDDLSQHRMHAERYEISAQLCGAIASTKRSGKRVVAVGTTVTRALESAAQDGELRPRSGETRLFIAPGFQFRVIDALVTNFHLPESTLLMLVCAFGGKDRVLDAYRHAVQKRYRFFSYGDAMLIEPRTASVIST